MTNQKAGRNKKNKSAVNNFDNDRRAIVIFGDLDHS